MKHYVRSHIALCQHKSSSQKKFFQNNILKLSSLNKLQVLHNFNVHKFSFLLPQDNFYILNSVMLLLHSNCKEFL